MDENRFDFEESLKELERISQEMKRDDISLDEALKLFEEGQKRYKECSEMLDRADQKIETFIKDASK